jgi:hypothetical protein
MNDLGVTLSILSMACTVPLKDYLTLVMLRVNDTSLLLRVKKKKDIDHLREVIIMRRSTTFKFTIVFMLRVETSDESYS